MRRVKAIIDQVAHTDITVLIKGESGTGREFIAETIHRVSPRAQKHFVKLNCAAIPKNLLESELFGFEKGAFTGAESKKPGKFELANGGTILLNDIDGMDISIQGKLLQFLQDGKFSRLGGDEDILVNARVIVTTKNHLERSIIEGRFREDLFYRINIVSIALPPLRERREQILPLAEYFFDVYREKFGKDIPFLSPKEVKIFKEYPWPGNIRELENVIKRMIVTSNPKEVVRKLLGKGEEAGGQAEIAINSSSAIGEPLPNLKEVGKRAGEKAEKELIQKTLFETQWNRKEAAKLLHISYKALLYKIEKYQLNRLKNLRRISAFEAKGERSIEGGRGG